MKGRRAIYSREELDWVRDNCTLMIGELHQAFCNRFGRNDISAGNLNALRKRNGWKTGRTGHFSAGQTSWNKGRRMPFNPNSAATRFKKGDVPANRKPVGHERIDAKDGYVYIKIDEVNPNTGFRGHYVHKHRHLWEQKHGPVPDDMVLKCLSGDKTDCDPANWKMIPRAMLPRLNGRFGREYDTAPEILKPVIMSVAELEHKSRSLANSKAEAA